MPSIALPVSLRGQLLSGVRSAVAVFSPIDLFATGAQGIWLDPSDLSTMFSDRAGTTPVTTPGTVVGLRLDKSKGLVLGSELVTNGDFSGGTTGWLGASSPTLSVVSGELELTRTATGWYAYQDFVTVTGKTYIVTGTVRPAATNSVAQSGRIALSSPLIAVAADSNGTTKQVKIIFVATGTSTQVALGVASGGATGATGDKAYFDNISVRELAGNHAVAPTDAARPIYGVEPKGGRRNLLTFSEQFDNAAWSKAAGTVVTANQVVAPDGTTTADLVVGNGTNGLFSQAITVPSNSQNTKSVWLRGVSGGETVILKDSTQTVSTVTCTLTTSWQRFTLTETQTGTTLGLWVDDIPAGGIYIWGAQLELGSTATNYQKVTTAYDITEAGVVSCHYVQYDGSDDSMSTSAIDFTATDKMSVFAGVRFNAYSANATVYGLSTDFTSIAGTFGLRANSASAVQILLNGTSLSNVQPTVPTMPSNVLFTHLMDIGATTGVENGLRVNGGAVTYAPNSAGTGNFSNQPLFIGRFAGTSGPLNGKDYGLIIVGKAASAGEITDTELWLSDKTAEVDVAKSISPNIYTRSGDTILDRANSIIERRTV